MLSSASFHDAAGSLILLPAGLTLFTNALSAADVDSQLERTQAALESLLGVVDSLEQRGESPSGFPSDAITEWKKRELAVWDFDTALRGGDLRATAYTPASGQRTDVDWLVFHTASRSDHPFGRRTGAPGRSDRALERLLAPDPRA